MSDYEIWKEKYYNKKIVEYSKYFSTDDIQILKKLEVNINLKTIYTEYEHDCFNMKLIEYYNIMKIYTIINYHLKKISMILK